MTINMGAHLVLPEDQQIFDKHSGKQYLPDSKLKILPESRKAAPGSLVTFYRALPPGVKFFNSIPDNLYWWPDISFIPHSECDLINSVGAYLHRPGSSALVAHSRSHGMIFTMTLAERIKCSIIKGTVVSGLPNVAMHPGGNTFSYAYSSKIIMMNLTTLWKTSRDNDIRLNIFKYTAFSPSGQYVAVMSRCSKFIELETFRIDMSYFMKQFYIDCHHVCPGFRTDVHNPRNFECKFSADSDHIACASAHGQLFIVKRYELKKHCNIIPGMFEHSTTMISNERSFDFDPRFFHQQLAFCDQDSKLYVCDIDRGVVNIEMALETESEVQCLKYCPSGRALAIALSDGTIRMHDPDTLDVLYVLDANNLCPESRMVRNAGGTHPTIIHMSYACTGTMLATTATDGIVRVWQLHPDLSLQQLCRRAVLQHCKMRDVLKLPLPVRLRSFLLQWAET